MGGSLAAPTSSKFHWRQSRSPFVLELGSIVSVACSFVKPLRVVSNQVRPCKSCEVNLNGTRTHDLYDTDAAVYQLSYHFIWSWSTCEFVIYT